MKLLRYGSAGQERPGMLDAQGRLRALSPAIGDISPELRSPQGLAVLARSIRKNYRWETRR